MIQIQRRTDLRDAAVLSRIRARVQQHDLVGERHGFDLVVRHVDDAGFVELLVQARDLDAGLTAQGSVEIGERFVEEKNAGLAHDRPANRHALPLAA